MSLCAANVTAPMNSIELPSTNANGEYHGAALAAVVNSIPSDIIKERILRRVGIQEIDTEAWYDLHTARAIYFGVEQMIGANTIHYVGQNIIHNAQFPENITNSFEALNSIKDAYTNSVRGKNLGEISFKKLDDKNAVMEFSSPFSCQLDQGIMTGCTIRYGDLITILHVGNSCRSQGDDSCTYHVSIRPLDD